jgi:hypothetical protein
MAEIGLMRDIALRTIAVLGESERASRAVYSNRA